MIVRYVLIMLYLITDDWLSKV